LSTLFFVCLTKIWFLTNILFLAKIFTQIWQIWTLLRDFFPLLTMIINHFLWLQKRLIVNVLFVLYFFVIFFDVRPLPNRIKYCFCSKNKINDCKSKSNRSLSIFFYYNRFFFGGFYQYYRKYLVNSDIFFDRDFTYFLFYFEGYFKIR